MLKLVLGLLLMFALPAVAQDVPMPGEQAKAPVQRVYAKPTQSNIIKAMLRAQAVDATDPAVQDDYILLNECQIFLKNSQDDFQLNKLRRAVQQVIERDRAGWPDAFVFISPLQLDSYDFVAGNFKLRPSSQLKNVNSFVLLESKLEVCQQGRALKRVPRAISVRVDQPVTVSSLPLNEQQGKALLDRMLKSGNTARQIFARFNIAISYMPPIEIKEKADPNARYVFDGKLSSIEFFEDEALTRPIWTFVKD